MPSIETTNLNQYAVLWEAGSLDDYGELKVSSPVEIPCRWEYKQEEVSDPLSGTTVSEATVYVNQSIGIGSILWEGALADLPVTPTNLKRVAAVGRIPDVKGKKTRRFVRLVTYSNTLPTVE